MSVRYRCCYGNQGRLEKAVRLTRVVRAIGVAAPAAITAILTAGCMVGPNFSSPPPPTVSSLTPEPLPRSPMPGPDQQAYVKELDIPQQWWSLFRCKPLNRIAARAIETNADVEAAQAAVRIANANTEAARGSFFPQIGANFGSSTQKPSAAQVQSVGGTSVAPYSLSTGQLSVSYMPDIFGLNRRQVELLAAQEEVQHFELEATYLTLTSKLALAAVQEASLREQIKSAETIIDVARDVLSLLQKQLDANEFEPRRCRDAGGCACSIRAAASGAFQTAWRQPGSHDRAYRAFRRRGIA